MLKGKMSFFGVRDSCMFVFFFFSFYSSKFCSSSLYVLETLEANTVGLALMATSIASSRTEVWEVGGKGGDYPKCRLLTLTVPVSVRPCQSFDTTFFLMCKIVETCLRYGTMPAIYTYLYIFICTDSI